MNPSNQLGIYGQKQPVKPQDAPLNPEKSLLQSSQQAKSPSLRPSTGAGEGQGKGKFRVLTGFWGGGGGPQPAAWQEEDAIALGAGWGVLGAWRHTLR